MPETQTPQRREDPTHHSNSPPSERLTWGWGALPVIQPAPDPGNFVDTDTEDDLPMMVKSDSVYFDAMEGENSPSTACFAGKQAVCIMLGCHSVSLADLWIALVVAIRPPVHVAVW